MKALYDLSKQERNNNKQRRRLSSSTQMILDKSSSSSSSSSRRKKRKAAVEQQQQAATTAAREEEDETQTHDDANLCSFCKRVPPAVNIQVPATQRQSQSETRTIKPYCLTCYYTTSAIRLDKDKYVSVVRMNQDDDKDGSSMSLSQTPELDKQLPAIQKLFSEAFLELQQELSEESVRAFRQQKSDPLASLLSSGGSGARKKKKNRSSLEKPPPPSKNPKGDNTDESAGGFLRSVPLPERLLKVQQQQAQVHAQQLARMNKAAAASEGASSTSDVTSSLYHLSREASSSSSLYKRRKTSKQSIWNLAMDPATEKALQDAKMSGKAATSTATTLSVPPCTCGSTNVEPFGNITSRNQDLRKGEIWGGKDRSDDVVTRYRCNQCGKTWNEES